MLDLESEDMLPRQAPQPTPLICEDVLKPSVPEVSIVMNQEPPTAPSQLTPNATQSYANWKKQCLPKVSYPPSLDKDFALANSTVSNVYPMRSAIIRPQTQIHSNIEQLGVRRFPETSPMSSFPLDNASTIVACSPSYTLTNQHRRSLDQAQAQISAQQFKNSSSFNDDVLTICAGTQTTFDSGYESRDFATKQDIDSIMKTLVEIRKEQTRLTDICQILLGERKPPSVLRDTATQCDGTGLIVGVMPQKRPPPIIYDYIDEESAENHNAYRNRPNHGFQNNSPQFKLCHSTDVATAAQQSNVILPKPVTEKSIVMNELALKYLPNDKLSELLQELRVNNDENCELVQGKNTLSAKRIDVHGKDPNEISNASYKYLKKYRLLPDDHGNNCGGNFMPQKQQETPTPYLHRNQQQQLTTNQENMLDLDALRMQPKFL